MEDGASQGAHSDERSSLALDWRWPLPQRTERIVSMNSVSGSVPPVPTRPAGPVYDKKLVLLYPSAYPGQTYRHLPQRENLQFSESGQVSTI